MKDEAEHTAQSEDLSQASLSTDEHHQPSWVVCLLSTICFLFTFSCSQETEHMAEAINGADSLPFMHSRGINTLISDSGVMRYRMVAEEWDIYAVGNQPATWKFMKGLLMERFDENFHIDLYVQADTAYLHDQNTWELRGRVVIRNINDELFLTEELFWDMNVHEMWSHKFMRIITPERELQGTEFHSNEQMTKYEVSNSAGAFPVSDTENQPPTDSIPPGQTEVSQPQEPVKAASQRPDAHSKRTSK